MADKRINLIRKTDCATGAGSIRMTVLDRHILRDLPPGWFTYEELPSDLNSRRHRIKRLYDLDKVERRINPAYNYGNLLSRMGSPDFYQYRRVEKKPLLSETNLPIREGGQLTTPEHALKRAIISALEAAAVEIDCGTYSDVLVPVGAIEDIVIKASAEEDAA